MRLDHIAFRVADRVKTARYFTEVFNFRIQQEFTIDFGGGESAQCIALEPSEKPQEKGVPWTHLANAFPDADDSGAWAEYHLPPEIFVSDGTPGSVVGEWVKARGGIGGIHHMAFLVDDVEATMRTWREKGYAEFTSEEPMKCPGLTQCFTKPSDLTGGVIIELIERDEFGFCTENVKNLMLSTSELSQVK